MIKLNLHYVETIGWHNMYYKFAPITGVLGYGIVTYVCVKRYNISSAWSTNLLSTCCQPRQKSITDKYPICQLCPFVVGGQHALSKFVL